MRYGVKKIMCVVTVAEQTILLYDVTLMYVFLFLIVLYWLEFSTCILLETIECYLNFALLKGNNGF